MSGWRRSAWGALALLIAGRAFAHPIRSSYAEADYRPETGKVEIALRLFADDAEAALTRRAGKKISLEKTPPKDIDALLLAEVRAGLVVKAKDGKTQPLAWVGRELTDGGAHLWVYVSCPLPGGVAGARWADRVLREAFSDQLNSIRVRDHATTPAGQWTLLFTNEAEQGVPGK